MMTFSSLRSFSWKNPNVNVNVNVGEYEDGDGDEDLYAYASDGGDSANENEKERKDHESKTIGNTNEESGTREKEKEKEKEKEREFRDDLFQKQKPYSLSKKKKVKTKKILKKNNKTGKGKKKKWLFLRKRPLDYQDDLLVCFLNLCEEHSEFFFEKTHSIDVSLLAIAYSYMEDVKKKKVSKFGGINNLFFCAISLAWATEEDSFLGEEQVLSYHNGEIPSNEEYHQLCISEQIAFDLKALNITTKLQAFNKAKNLLWRCLDYRTHVHYLRIQYVYEKFGRHKICTLRRDDRALKYIYDEEKRQIWES